jgi:hypothetical protein
VVILQAWHGMATRHGTRVKAMVCAAGERSKVRD